jgi:aspartyl-tRNA(Asn)/glutamyl-tRNA(Gln) amidotransferase subunit C
MVEVNEALIRKVAELARLECSDAEVADYVRSVGDVLGYVAQLEQVNTDGIDPMTHGVDFVLRSRADVAEAPAFDADGKPKVLSAAPEVLYDGYKVPQVL